MVTPQDVETALRVTPSFYEAAIDHERWPGVLKALRDVFEADVAQLAIVRLDRAQVIANLYCGAHPEAVRDWLAFDYSDGGDPRVERAIAFMNRPMHCRQLVTSEEFHASRMYREVFCKHDMEYTLAIHIVLESLETQILVAFIRKKDRAPWNDEDIDKFQLYVPHLRQALKVVCAFDYEKALSAAFAEAFDKMRLATAVIDGKAGIQYANPAAQALLDAGTAIWETQGRLSPTDSKAARRFRETVSRVACGIDDRPPLGATTMIFPRSDGLPGLYATLSPVSGALSSPVALLNKVVYAVLFLNDPTQRYETDLEHLQRLFGLTEAEAEVMKAYSEGASAPQIAEISGRSLETIRSHLKSVRDKTGARTQAEMSRLAISVQS